MSRSRKYHPYYKDRPSKGISAYAKLLKTMNQDQIISPTASQMILTICLIGTIVLVVLRTTMKAA